MSDAATPTLFGQKDLKLTPHVLSNIAFLCNPDKPVEGATTMGDIALSEICVDCGEAADMAAYLDTLRSEGQSHYISRVLEIMAANAKESRSADARGAIPAIEAEYARFAKVFFMRVRQFEVIRVSTDEIIGRIVVFPDQMADDYGNNLEEHTEEGINKTKVEHAIAAKDLPTVYVGHGAGSAMAQLCGCASGSTSIIFDGTLLASLLVKNAVAHGAIKAEAPEEESEVNIVEIRTAASQQRVSAVEPHLDEAAKQASEEEKAAEEEQKKAEAAKNNQRGAAPKKDEKEDDKTAEEYFEKKQSYIVRGYIAAAATARFEKTGRYGAAQLSDMLIADHVSIRPVAK